MGNTTTGCIEWVNDARVYHSYGSGEHRCDKSANWSTAESGVEFINRGLPTGKMFWMTVRDSGNLCGTHATRRAVRYNRALVNQAMATRKIQCGR